MAPDALKAYVVEQLRTAREGLLAISSDDLTPAHVTEWKVRYWELALVPASRQPGNVPFLQLYWPRHSGDTCSGSTSSRSGLAHKSRRPGAFTRNDRTLSRG